MLEDELLAPGVISATYVSALAPAKRGAWPLGIAGVYDIDDAHLARYARAARTREGFQRYLDEFVCIPRRAARLRDRSPDRRRPARRRRRGFAYPRCRLRTPRRGARRCASRLHRRKAIPSAKARGSSSTSRVRGASMSFLGGAQIDGGGEHQPGARRRPAFPRIVRLGFHVRGGEADDPLSRGAFSAVLVPRVEFISARRPGGARHREGALLVAEGQTPLPAGKRARARRHSRRNRVRLRCPENIPLTEVPSSEDLACCGAGGKSHSGGLPRFRKASVGTTLAPMNAPEKLKQFDREARAVGNIVHLEHFNVCIPDQRLATLFYVVGLGGTRDPYLFMGLENMWVNFGRTQVHHRAAPFRRAPKCCAAPPASSCRASRSLRSASSSPARR